MFTEKEKLVGYLWAGEEMARGTGRTTKMIDSAVHHALQFEVPVTIVGWDGPLTKRFVEIAHEMIDERVPQDRAESFKSLVTGVPFSERDRLSSTNTMVFEDHLVWMKRAEEAIRGL